MFTSIGGHRRPIVTQNQTRSHAPAKFRRRPTSDLDIRPRNTIALSYDDYLKAYGSLMSDIGCLTPEIDTMVTSTVAYGLGLPA